MTARARALSLDGPRIGLVSCGSVKAIEPCAAKDMYGSALFRAARAYVEATCARWYILSAKFGLLEPERRIAPYDTRLHPRWTGAWGKRVGQELDAAVPWPLERNAELIVLAGELYADAISLPGTREIYWDEPLKGLGIGARISWLKKNTPTFNPQPLEGR